VNKFISTFTNEEMTKIKVVDFENLHNFVDLKFSLLSIKENTKQRGLFAES